MPLRARHGQWHYRFKIQGKTFSGSTGLAATAQKRSAAESIEKKQRAARLERFVPASNVIGIDFATAAGNFLAHARDVKYRQKPATAQRIKVSLASLVVFFGSRAAHAIDAAAIEQYKEWRISEHKVKDITLRHDLHALSLFFQYAQKRGWCFSNVVRQVAIPSDREAVRDNILTVEQESAYFAAAAKIKDRNGRTNLFDLGRLMINQGLRPEEAMRLRKDDFDLPAKQLRIRAGKTKAAQRILDLTAESFSILSARLNSEGVWLFPSDRKRGFHLAKLNCPHDKACEAAGVSFTLYDLRHTFGTRHATEAKTDAFTLARIMGHANLRTIMRYVHPNAEQQKLAMNRYEAAQQRKKMAVVR